MNLSGPVRAALLALLLSPAAGAAAAEEPRLVPLPRAPAGPSIRRVTHDALRPVLAGSTLSVQVLTEPGAAVSAKVGSGGEPVACTAKPGGKGAFRCSLLLPTGLSGLHHVVAEARDRRGRVSSLSSILPVEIRPGDTWESVNALNARLRPVFFAPGSASLDETATTTLAANLGLLESHSALVVVIEGHCDSAEAEDREALATRRAESVAEHLASLGLPRNRLTVTGKSDSVPLLRGDDPQATALNRRVMVLLQVVQESPDP